MARVRHDLRATEAGRFALLLPPAAVRPEMARGQPVHDRGQQLDDPRGEATIRAVEMPAGMARARSPEAENRGR